MVQIHVPKQSFKRDHSSIIDGFTSTSWKLGPAEAGKTLWSCLVNILMHNVSWFALKIFVSSTIPASVKFPVLVVASPNLISCICVSIPNSPTYYSSCVPVPFLSHRLYLSWSIPAVVVSCDFCLYSSFIYHFRVVMSFYDAYSHECDALIML